MTARRFAMAVIVAIAVGGPVVEMFDQWDHTPQTGSDTEVDAVIVALCVGVGFMLAGGAVQRLRALAARSERLRATNPPPIRRTSFRAPASSNPSSSPPLPLRV